ncbi:hypothetical protein V5O48_005894 [Marasmius crinis-equi]|uniref:Oxidized purine nucleoside triphosphate hydrolase n=1 Tax=Marasmius crinis-equi TaxID=585013 RepID=A0ABR3FLE0_9AGAR
MNLDSSNPPGVQGNLQGYCQGGDSPNWLPYEHVKYYTNAFIVRDQEILLGFKKRGFGQHKYNGFGGKVEPGESSLEAATRELKEEAGISANLEHAGVLFFISEGEQKAFHIDIYRAEEYTGTITETDEMRPEWFSFQETSVGEEQSSSLPAIPYDRMWEDDLHWMPLLLARRKFAGRVDFRKQDGKLSKWWFGTVVSP